MLVALKNLSKWKAPGHDSIPVINPSLSLDNFLWEVLSLVTLELRIYSCWLTQTCESEILSLLEG